MGAPATLAWAAPVELVSQSRTVTVEVQQATEGGEVLTDQDSASATGFGVFEAAVEATVTPEGEDGSSLARATTRSDIREDRLEGRGTGFAANLSRDEPSFNSLSDLFTVVFDVTEAVQFEGDYSVDFMASEGDVTGEVALRRISEAGETQEDFEFGFGPDLRVIDVELGAGRYELSSVVRTDQDPGLREYQYSFGFDLTAVDDGTDGGGGGGGGGGGEPNPIPLPPAALAGLSVMGGAGLFGSIRKRLRARRA